MKFFTYSAIIFTLFSSPIVQADESRALTLATAAPDQSEQKLALVIGNADYQSSPLKNPVNDARAMSAKLEQLGFEIIKYENLKQKQLGMVLRTFRS
ncbi:MAG: caspase family protein [Candidatus Obscuribacterales bacterium]|nr:caspase family protein [Candidatus Obscuribacterales bacterium]